MANITGWNIGTRTIFLDATNAGAGQKTYTGIFTCVGGSASWPQYILSGRFNSTGAVASTFTVQKYPLGVAGGAVTAIMATNAGTLNSSIAAPDGVANSAPALANQKMVATDTIALVVGAQNTTLSSAEIHIGFSAGTSFVVTEA